MLTKKDMNLLNDISRDLLEYGLLNGEELEWYIKANILGFINIQSENHYLEIEDYVLNFIDKRRKKMLFIKDIKTNKEYLFPKPCHAEKVLGVSKDRFLEISPKGRLVARRYLAKYINANIKDLNEEKNYKECI